MTTNGDYTELEWGIKTFWSCSLQQCAFSFHVATILLAINVCNYDGVLISP